MSEQLPPFIEMVQACEAAILRIRTATCDGNSHSAEVSDDLELIRQAVEPYFARLAKEVNGLAPGAEEEARQAMFDQLHDHIRSLTYPSLATRFGAYLKRAPRRAIRKTRQNYVLPGQRRAVARLDSEQDNDGYRLGEFVADPRAEAAFTSVLDRMALQGAIALLSDKERQVVALLTAGYTNNEIAQQLAISPSTATRIRQRAAARIQRSLGDTDE